MKRGWKAVYEDGTTATEEQMHWTQLDLDRVVQLSIVYDGLEYGLPAGQKGWLQAKTASVVVGDKPKIESRYIGFRLGNSQIILRVMEDTGSCIMELR